MGPLGGSNGFQVGARIGIHQGEDHQVQDSNGTPKKRKKANVQRDAKRRL